MGQRGVPSHPQGVRTGPGRAAKPPKAGRRPAGRTRPESTQRGGRPRGAWQPALRHTPQGQEGATARTDLRYRVSSLQSHHTRTITSQAIGSQPGGVASDEELLDAARAGDRAAVAELYD